MSAEQEPAVPGTEPPSHRIDSLARLRSLMGEPSSVVRQKIHSSLNQTARDFISRSPMLFLATCGADGVPTVSPKGDRPGFVGAQDPNTLLIPERAGNRLLVSLQNILENEKVGLIFVVPGSGETFRVHGRAELSDAPSLLDAVSAGGRRALLVTRVSIESCYFHCARAFLRSNLWKPALWPPETRISFGSEVAERAGLTREEAARYDDSVERCYREES